jgi:PhnB protein
MQVSPHLIFNGQCETAFQFYEKCLGGKIPYKKTFAETPMGQQVPADFRDKVIHATFKLADQTLMGADAPPPHYKKPQGFGVTIEVKDPAEAERIYHALSENGQVQMPMQETFWAHRLAPSWTSSASRGWSTAGNLFRLYRLTAAPDA